MNSKQSPKERNAESSERRDPFAVDIFGDDTQGQPTPGLGLKSVKTGLLPEGVTRDWSSSLDVLNYGVDSVSEQTPGYPEWLEREVTARVLPKLARFADESVESTNFAVLSYDDIEFSEAARKLADASHVIVHFESGGLEGFVAVSSEFASGLIDMFLGGSGRLHDSLRKLSGIELALCEYFSAVVLSAMNEGLDGQRRLRLIRLGNEDSDLVYDGRAVEIVGDLGMEKLSGMVSVVLTHPLLEELNQSFESIDSRDGADLVKKLDRTLFETRLCLGVGTTAIAAVELPFLERDDVVLINSGNQNWWSRNPDCGTLSCYVGTSKNLFLKGSFEDAADDPFANFRLFEAREEPYVRSYGRIRKSVFSEGVETVKEAKDLRISASAEVDAKDEDRVLDGESSSREAPDEGLVALENVMIDLRVLVAGRKISLSELGELRAGQVVDLGCKPEDPVELVAENSDRPIASGELVMIDDQLGVRITKVFV